MAVTPKHPPADEEASVTSDRNGVAVEFADGARRSYAVVVRPSGGDWVHAERLVGDGDGFDDEEFEALNPDSIRRIRSDRVHFSDGGVVHVGDGLLVDPGQLAAKYNIV